MMIMMDLITHLPETMTPGAESGNGAVPVPQILWQSCDGIMVIDEARRVVAMNPTLERWTGRCSADVIGQTDCGVLLGCHDLHGSVLRTRPNDCYGLRAIRQGTPIQGAEYTIGVSGGRRRVVSASYTPVHLRPQGPLWTVVMLRDVTARKRWERRLLRRAATDALTGLLNRASVLEACRHELRRASRYGRPLTIAMADLDGLKRYNDAYGHQAGDALLTTVADILGRGHRSPELVARYGGDEFALLLPETRAAKAVVVAERLRRAVSEAVKGAPITISIGLAEFPTDGTTAEALFAQADRRLYEGKRQGGNRVIGPMDLKERRREPRLAVHAPVFVRSLIEEPSRPLHEGRTINLSLRGVSLTIPKWKPIVPDDMLLLSIPIPSAHRAHFPCPRLAGCGRVVRILQEVPPDDPSGVARLRLAVEFADI